MVKHLERFAHDDSGATMIEYGLIVALVAVAAIVALEALGTSVRGLFTPASTKIDSTILQ